MKREKLLNYFEKIKELTAGNNLSDSSIIDYENGMSISLDELEEEYEKYIKLQDKIDDYIEENDLDDVINKDQIKNHFSRINENCFKFNQAVLKDFVDYMTIIINDRKRVR